MKIFRRILLSILSVIVVILFVIMCFFVYSYKTGSLCYILNYSTFFVYGSSMNPFLKENDLIIIKDMDEYKVDDIITFKDNNDLIITHRIYKIKNDRYLTKGDHNLFADKYQVKKDDIYGKFVLKIPYIGYILNFILAYKYYFIGGVFSIFIIMIINSRRKNVR